MGRDMPIDGRPCRTEVAKVNRKDRILSPHIAQR